MLKTELVGMLISKWEDNQVILGRLDFGKFTITIQLRGNPPLGSQYAILLKDVTKGISNVTDTDADSSKIRS